MAFEDSRETWKVPAWAHHNGAGQESAGNIWQPIRAGGRLARIGSQKCSTELEKGAPEGAHSLHYCAFAGPWLVENGSGLRHRAAREEAGETPSASRECGGGSQRRLTGHRRIPFSPQLASLQRALHSSDSNRLETLHDRLVTGVSYSTSSQSDLPIERNYTAVFGMAA